MTRYISLYHVKNSRLLKAVREEIALGLFTSFFHLLTQVKSQVKSQGLAFRFLLPYL